MVGNLAFGLFAASPRSLETFWKFENPSIVNFNPDVFQQFRSCRKLQISSKYKQIAMRTEPELGSRASRKAFIVQTLFAVSAIYGNSCSIYSLSMSDQYIPNSLVFSSSLRNDVCGSGSSKEATAEIVLDKYGAPKQKVCPVSVNTISLTSSQQN